MLLNRHAESFLFLYSYLHIPGETSCPQWTNDMAPHFGLNCTYLSVHGTCIHDHDPTLNPFNVQFTHPVPGKIRITVLAAMC